MTTTLSTPEDTLTLLLETQEGEQEVPVTLDFSDLSAIELEKVGKLVRGDFSNPLIVTIAFIFVKASRQAELADDDFLPFLKGLTPMFEGDPSVVTVRGVPDGE